MISGSIKSSRTKTLEDEERPRRPSTSSDKQHAKDISKKLVLPNRQITIRDLPNGFGT